LGGEGEEEEEEEEEDRKTEKQKVQYTIIDEWNRITPVPIVVSDAQIHQARRMGRNQA
jgi:hypothetical protein